MRRSNRYYSRKVTVMVASVLTLCGIATGLVYVQYSTPMTMVLFLVVGQVMFLSGIMIFLWAQFRDVRSRLDSFQTRRFESGEVIYRQSDPAEHFYLIRSGEVEFTRRSPDGAEAVLGRLGPEEHFGEFAMLGSLVHQATARALTCVEVVSIHCADFERIYTNVDSFRRRIDSEAARRRKLNEKVAN